jgi:hypothetical protein
MSNLPSFLPAKNPHPAVLTNGDPYPLTPVEITTLLRDINALHFRPQIIVAPSNYHVKNGDVLVSEIATDYKLGPHSLLVVYSPADKNVWVQCGAFNSSAGVDPAFFRHDFLQRMTGSSQDGNLASALTASLKDVDQIIVRSQAFAAAQVNRQTSEVQPRHPVHTTHHTTHGGASTLMQVLPAVLAALVILNFIGRKMASAAPRRRFDDPDERPADLADDVDRILKVIHHTDGGAYGDALKPRNTQVPMAEFKKRADSPVKVSAHGAASTLVSAYGDNGGRFDGQNSASANTSQRLDDHSTELTTALDSSAARVRREFKEKTASYDSSSNSDESPPAVVQDGRFIDSYVATFAGTPEAPKEAMTSVSPAPTSLPVPTPMPAPPPQPQLLSPNESFTKLAASSTPITSSPPGVPIISTTPISPNTPITPNIPITPTPAATTPGSSFDLSSYSLQAASAPFADVLSSMGSNLGDMKTSAGGSLPLGSLSSFDTDHDPSVVQAACPKCSEPKSKDFSFCLKCGFNY